MSKGSRIKGVPTTTLDPETDAFYDQTIGGEGQLKLLPHQVAVLKQTYRDLVGQMRGSKGETTLNRVLADLPPVRDYSLQHHAPSIYWNPAWDPYICTTQVDPEKSQDDVTRELMQELTQMMREHQMVILKPRAAGQRTRLNRYLDNLITLVPPQPQIDGELLVRVIKKRNALEPSKYIVLNSLSRIDD